MFIHDYTSKTVEEKNITKHYAGQFNKVIKKKFIFFSSQPHYNTLITQSHVS